MTVELVGDKEIMAAFDKLPQEIHFNLLKAITILAVQLESHVKTDKLEGQVLNHIHGFLQGSIHSETSDSGSEIVGRVYSSGCNYAAIHEYGFSGSEIVREHVRSHLFGREVDPFTVPSFTRQMNMPERSFLRSSLKDYEQKIIDGITEAVAKAIKT